MHYITNEMEMSTNFLNWFKIKFDKSIEKNPIKWYSIYDMKKIDKKQQIKIIKIILIVIWMIVIFNFSNQGGTKSSGTSQKVTKVIVNIITDDKKEANINTMEKIEKVVRKGAHYTIYTIGGFLLMNYAYSTDKTKKHKIFGSLLFGAFYAVTDELHQFFVPGRSARLFDVGIDTLGVLTGIFIYMGIRTLFEKVCRKNVEIRK